eukprot:g8799.t1
MWRRRVSALLLLIPSSALHTDEVGQYDWHLKQIGKPTALAFSVDSDHIYAATESGVVASMMMQDGRLHWRRDRGAQSSHELWEPIHLLRCVGRGLLSATEHGLVQAWKGGTGDLSWQRDYGEKVKEVLRTGTKQRFAWKQVTSEKDPYYKVELEILGNLEHEGIIGVVEAYTQEGTGVLFIALATGKEWWRPENLEDETAKEKAIALMAPETWKDLELGHGAWEFAESMVSLEPERSHAEDALQNPWLVLDLVLSSQSVLVLKDTEVESRTLAGKLEWQVGSKEISAEAHYLAAAASEGNVCLLATGKKGGGACTVQKVDSTGKVLDKAQTDVSREEASNAIHMSRWKWMA